MRCQPATEENQLGLLVNENKRLREENEKRIGDPSSDQGSSLAKQTADALALSVRGRTGPVEPYLAVIVGLDDDARIVSDFAITAGVAMPLR